MTHEDRWRVDSLNNAFEMLHEGGNREALDGRWIAVERLDLDLEARIRWREDEVASGLIARDPVLPASRRHPEAMNQDDRIGTFRWRGHGRLLVRRLPVLLSVTPKPSICHPSDLRTLAALFPATHERAHNRAMGGRTRI